MLRCSSLLFRVIGCWGLPKCFAKRGWSVAQGLDALLKTKCPSCWLAPLGMDQVMPVVVQYCSAGYSFLIKLTPFLLLLECRLCLYQDDKFRALQHSLSPDNQLCAILCQGLTWKRFLAVRYTQSWANRPTGGFTSTPPHTHTHTRTHAHTHMHACAHTHTHTLTHTHTHTHTTHTHTCTPGPGFKGKVRTINDRNICERRSCMKNNGKSPTFKFVSGEERRPQEVQRVSRNWRLPGATHSSADLTWIRKWLEIQTLELSELESVELELGSCCSDLDK